MDYCIKCSQPLFHGTIPHRCIADIPCPSCAALRARIEVLEKVVIDVDEAMRGDYHREGTKIRIVVTQESLNRFRAALDALKEGKG
jgi:hypothetical protein